MRTISWATNIGNLENFKYWIWGYGGKHEISDVSYLTKSYQAVQATPYVPENDLA